jgi:hypothetical protein
LLIDDHSTSLSKPFELLAIRKNSTKRFKAFAWHAPPTHASDASRPPP